MQNPMRFRLRRSEIPRHDWCEGTAGEEGLEEVCDWATEEFVNNDIQKEMLSD